MESKKDLEKMDEEDLEELLSRIENEKEERKAKFLSNMSEDELKKYEGEVKMNLENLKKRGRINGDPIISL